MRVWILVGCLVAVGTARTQEPARRPAKEALQAFNELIGAWRATGTPEARAERQNFWTETMTWGWQFRGGDAWLTLTVEPGKHFVRGELRYLPERDAFRLNLVTPTKESLAFEGPLKEKRLVVERRDAAKNEVQQLTLSLLHENRVTLAYRVRPTDREQFRVVYTVGATKEGVPFATRGDGRPECIVSGGLGSMAVSHGGKTYYVCCSGCRDAFKEEPEKYIREYEAKRAKEGKK